MITKILVTNGSNKNTLTVLRTLGRDMYWIDVTSSFPKIITLSSYSKYCKKLIF